MELHSFRAKLLVLSHIQTGDQRQYCGNHHNGTQSENRGGGPGETWDPAFGV